MGGVRRRGGSFRSCLGATSQGGRVPLELLAHLFGWYPVLVLQRLYERDASLGDLDRVAATVGRLVGVEDPAKHGLRVLVGQ